MSNKSRFAQELVSTILFTVAVGLVWYEVLHFDCPFLFHDSCINFPTLFQIMILFFSFSRLMGAAALQKYIGSLGGIGTSGVGSSSSYTPKELNKEVMPEKVNIQHFVLKIFFLLRS